MVFTVFKRSWDITGTFFTDIIAVSEDKDEAIMLMLDEINEELRIDEEFYEKDLETKRKIVNEFFDNGYRGHVLSYNDNENESKYSYIFRDRTYGWIIYYEQS